MSCQRIAITSPVASGHGGGQKDEPVGSPEGCRRRRGEDRLELVESQEADVGIGVGSWLLDECDGVALAPAAFIP